MVTDTVHRQVVLCRQRGRCRSTRRPRQRSGRRGPTDPIRGSTHDHDRALTTAQAVDELPLVAAARTVVAGDEATARWPIALMATDGGPRGLLDQWIDPTPGPDGVARLEDLFRNAVGDLDAGRGLA